MEESKLFSSFKIPERKTAQENAVVKAPPMPDITFEPPPVPTVTFEPPPPPIVSFEPPPVPDIFIEPPPFAEIEVDGGETEAFKPIPVPEAIVPLRDERRQLFHSMRELSRQNHSSYFTGSKYYDKQAQYEHSKIFYKQAVFMKDFEDDFSDSVSFSSYFPYYQLMSHEQLRTYFSWRTKVRRGEIEYVSLSYGFVYIYELINQIGVYDPADGLEKLLTFWECFQEYHPTIEKYLIKWVKDYYVYYGLPGSFKEFIAEKGLRHHYPDIAEYVPVKGLDFKQLCGISKYNIKESAFYNDTTSELIDDCLEFVINQLSDVFAQAGIIFQNLIFQPSQCGSFWIPFSGALFYPAQKQPDCRVVLSDSEIYVCCQNRWTVTSVITLESGKNLLGYIFKQTEAVLRKVTKYKYKLSANLNMVGGETLLRLIAVGISLEKSVTDAVLAYYREKNKTVVSVNPSMLEKIRLDALDTLEKLIVPQEEALLPDFAPIEQQEQMEVPVTSDGWASLKNMLNQTEFAVLAAVLSGKLDIKRLSADKGVMPEVLVDSINEKAFDAIGDSILELQDEIILYEEYKEKIETMVKI